MAKGRLGRLSEHAGRNASERRAGLETGNAEADPPLVRGRLAAVGKRATRAPIGSAGVLAAACVQEGDSSNTGSPDGGAHAPTGNPRGPAWAGGVAERLVVPGKPGNAGGGKGPQFERGAARRQGHGDWRKPNSFRKRSETPEGATCESEGVSRLPILFVERQGVASGRNGRCLAGGTPEWRGSRSGRRNGAAHRATRSRTVAWGTGAGLEGRHLSTECGAAGVDPKEAGGEGATAGHTVHPGPGGADGGAGSADADLRSGPGTGAVRLSGGPERARRSQARASAAEHGPPGGG